MPTLKLTTEQAVNLVKQMPLEAKYAVIRSFNSESEKWRQQTLEEGEQRLRGLSAEKGLDWDMMSEAEREAFVDNLLREID